MILWMRKIDELLAAQGDDKLVIVGCDELLAAQGEDKLVIVGCDEVLAAQGVPNW